jgi:hypothetical protein
MVSASHHCSNNGPMSDSSRPSSKRTPRRQELQKLLYKIPELPHQQEMEGYL